MGSVEFNEVKFRFSSCSCIPRSLSLWAGLNAKVNEQARGLLL